MDINKQSEGTTLTIKLSGRLDAVSARDLDKVVGSSLDGVKDLIFDLADLSYVASAGLRVLFVAQKKMNKQGSMKLVHVNDTVKEVFEITGFADFLTIE